MPDEKDTFIQKFRILFYFIATLWVIEIVNLLTAHSLSSLGIVPRTLGGLTGIPLAPFLHNSVMHLAFNSVPLAILGGLMILSGKKRLVKNTLFIIIVGGAGLWLSGRPGAHAGASGLVFGYFGYLAARGFFKRDILSVLISFFTVFSYGGLLWGIAPTFTRVSWEGHLCGFLAGILGAWIENRKA